MNVLAIFNEEEQAKPIMDGTKAIVEAFHGVRADLALAIMFQAWLVICKLADDADPGTEFERLIATFEARKQATHPLTLTVH